MYDRQTDSLWEQFAGHPVTGKLTGSKIELKLLPLVLTSWSEWRSRRPETRVLSLNTGFRRDYGPGVAYREYFASLAGCGKSRSVVLPARFVAFCPFVTR